MLKDQKLKIGLVFDDSLDSNDGVAQHVKTLGTWLDSQGHIVSYLVGQTELKTWSGGRVYSLAKNKSVYFNGNKMSIPLRSDSSKIKTVLDNEQFDILHVMVPYSPFMAQKVINLAGPNTIIIGTFHIYPSGLWAESGAKVLKLLYGNSLVKFTTFISVSPAAADFANRVFNIHTTIIANPIETKLFAQRPKKKKINPTIVFLGRLVKRKGCKELLQAFSLLSKKMPEARLVIAGGGANRQNLENLAAKLKITGKTNFLGYVSESKKVELLANADVACFPSLYGESFGIVLIEAMAAGSGVVLGGDNPGYRSVLGSQPELLIDPKNKQKFADRLHRLLSDSDLRIRIHSWQNSEVKKYDIKVVGPQILQVYTGAIARPAKKAHNKTHGK
jgi:phosphatidylinositol alpha-mannosyltransferase